MKKLFLALGCIAALTSIASCTADDVNDSNQKSTIQFSKPGDTIGDGGKDIPH